MFVCCCFFKPGKSLYFEICSVLLFNISADTKTDVVTSFIANDGQGWDLKPGVPTLGHYSA